MAVIVTNIFEKSRQFGTSDNRMPRFIRKLFFKHLARYLGMEIKAKELFQLLVNLKKKEKSEEKMKSSSNYGGLRSSEEKTSNPALDNCNDQINLISMIASDLKKRRENSLANNTSYNCNHVCGNCNKCFCCYYDQIKVINNLNLTTPIGSKRVLNFQQANESNRIDENLRNSRNGSESPVWIKKFKKETNKESHIFLNSERNGNSLFEVEKKKTKKSAKNKMVKMVNKDENRIARSKNGENKIFTINKENFSLYIAYEYVLISLILDRLFFWFYVSVTVLSYLFTLFIVPFFRGYEKNDYSKMLP